MKRKLINSLRLLLVAAGLCVGASAWADVTPVSQNYSSGVADWTSGNTGRYTVDMNAGEYLTVNAVGNGNNGATITGSTVNGKAESGDNFAASDDFTMIFDLQLNGGNNQNSWFHINDATNNNGGNEAVGTHVLTLYQASVNGTTWQINGSLSNTVTLSKSTWYTFKLTKSGSYLYLTVTPTAGGDPVFERQRINVNSTKGGLGNMIFQTKRYYSFMAIDNVVLREITEGDLPAVSYANYTVHFKDNNGTTIKDDEVRSGEVDSHVGASVEDKTSFIADDFKYVYNTDGDGTTVINDGSAEFTVTYTKYESTAYTVKAQVSGSDITTLASGTTYFDGSETKYWSKYIKVSDQWYVADETTYGVAITTATTNIPFTATNDIDYFFEAEDMAYSRTYNTYAGTAASNGSAKTLYADANAVTTSKVAAGVYTVSLSGIKWGDYADNYQIAYSVDGTNWISLGNIAYTASEAGVKILENALVPTEAYIRIWVMGGSQTPRRYLDYLALKKTADLPSTENIIVTSADFATYVSNYNLDFTSTSTKAYKVSVTEKGVAKLTNVDQVPAKTPVLLYCKGGNGSGEAIPVTTDAVSAVSGNDLVAGTGATVATTDGDYTNMILNNVSGIGFYYAAGQTVATNRAYLHIATTLAPNAEGGSSRMMMVFADETTGITSLTPSPSPKGEGSVYTLSGQRVEKPAKGLYIVNGKKVIIK